MARLKVFEIFVFTALICLAMPSKLIYRKYEKRHPKKNYVQIVEIFETRQEPPQHTESDKELNDFLARDAYKTDMNCTKANETESLVTTTVLPRIPTTAFRQVTTTLQPITLPSTAKSTSVRTPNLDDLFTIPPRPTKPTIIPNPRENNNPDYTNVIPWPLPNVQVTKHPPNTKAPTIVIKETDDDRNHNRTHLKDVDNNFWGSQTTTLRVHTTTEDAEILYKTSEEKESDDGYDEDNYDILTPTEQLETNNQPTRVSNGEYSDNEYDEEYDNNIDGDYEGELGKRRKRQKKTVLNLKRKHTSKT